MVGNINVIESDYTGKYIYIYIRCDYCHLCSTVTIDVVALTGCARSSLGICASSSGGVAGLLLWKVPVYLVHVYRAYTSEVLVRT